MAINQNINKTPQATLYGPSGAKQVVTVGSGMAANLQGSGWGLTANSYKAPGVTNSVTPPASANVTTVTSNPVTQSQLNYLGNYQNQYQDMLAAQRQALESGYQSQVAGINQGYGQQRQETMDVQNRNVGALQANLGRSGALTTSSGAMAQEAQSTANLNTLNKLTSARDAAIQQAAAARDAGNADLLSKSMEIMYKINNEIYGIMAQENQNYQARLDKEEERKAELAKTDLNNLADLAQKGYSYVTTPKQRDDLIKQGYEMTSYNGKTFAKAPEMVADEKEWNAYKRQGGTMAYNEYSDYINSRGKYKKATGGGGGTTVSGEQRKGKTQWDAESADALYKQYLSSTGVGDAYSAKEAGKRVLELTGIAPISFQRTLAQEHITANPTESADSLKLWLQQNTDLEISEINTMVDVARPGEKMSLDDKLNAILLNNK
jgi:hypothetical protein